MMNDTLLKDKIRSAVIGLGADVCGFASADSFMDAPEGFRPTDVWKHCKSVIVHGIALPKGIYEVEPKLIYSHFNGHAPVKVDEISENIARYVEDVLGATAVPLPGDGPYDEWNPETLTGHGIISVKHAAVAAGIGTLGKNTLLVNEKFGNRLTLGLVLTDIELESDTVAEPMCIEGCSLCIKSCPVGALDGKSANQTKCRPNSYGSNARGFDTVNCNRCRTVCPMRNGRNK